VSTALYNRYRPATFSQVVGQEHVTTALMQALRTGRLHHAYLFSGPRGCGKTSSARILAASLNCEQGPTPEPCGVCDQCVSIRTGSSMDVTEIDAASHGLVDDARDLRERAFFAPASARFKIFVVDEAHMVTAAAFNALLKVVEEPPPYLKFVFATTEPDKVIATIRSRTHHYAFRLVPPGVLRDHLASVSAQEGVEVDPSVLPLVVRAGAGSVRDSLSVLDQLLAGAGPEGLRYERAVALLGMTDGVLLDETVDALAARDGATLFTVVDKVVGSGHDPRRFTADLLERLRDLIMINAVPDAVERGLLDAFSADQIDRMKAQASRVGPAELSRTADVLHAGLAEMRGTASPRLLLELVLARALLPGAAADPAALLVRLERLERGLAAGIPAVSVPAAGAPSLGVPAVGVPAPAFPTAAPPGPGSSQAPAAELAAPTGPPTSSAPPNDPPNAPRQTSAAMGAPPAMPVPASAARPPGPAGPAEGASAARSGGGGPEAADVRARWDQVLAAARRRRVVTASLLVEHVSVLDVRSNEVFLALSTPPMAKVFSQSNHADVLGEALAETFGGIWRVTIGEPGAGRPGAAGGRGGPSRPPGGPAAPGSGPARPAPAGPATGSLPASTAGPSAASTAAGPSSAAAGPATWSARLPGGSAAAPSVGAGKGPGGPGTGAWPSYEAGPVATAPAAAAVTSSANAGAGGPAGTGGPASTSGGFGGFAGSSAVAGSSAAAAVRGPLGPGPQEGQRPTAARQGGGFGSSTSAPSLTVASAARAAAATVMGTGADAVGVPGSGSIPGGALAGGSGPAGPAATGGVFGGSAGFAADGDVIDEPSLDDDDAPMHPGAALTGEAAAMELLRVGLGATVIEPPGAG